MPDPQSPDRTQTADRPSVQAQRPDERPSGDDDYYTGRRRRAETPAERPPQPRPGTAPHEREGEPIAAGDDTASNGQTALIGTCAGHPLLSLGCASMGFGGYGMISGGAFAALGVTGQAGGGSAAGEALLGGAIALGVGLVFVVLGLPLAIGGLVGHGYALYDLVELIGEAFDAGRTWVGTLGVAGAGVTGLLIPAGCGGGALIGAGLLGVLGGLVASSFSVNDNPRLLFGALSVGGSAMLGFGVLAAVGALVALGATVAVDVALMGLGSPDREGVAAGELGPRARQVAASRMRF